MIPRFVRHLRKWFYDRVPAIDTTDPAWAEEKGGGQSPVDTGVYVGRNEEVSLLCQAVSVDDVGLAGTREEADSFTKNIGGNKWVFGPWTNGTDCIKGSSR